jgi:hypothetical protein
MEKGELKKADLADLSVAVSQAQSKHAAYSLHSGKFSRVEGSV